MTEILSVERVSTGLVLIDSMSFGDMHRAQLWSAVKARKSRKCALSGKSIRPGDLVYRPVGNASNRMKRILASEIDAAPLGGKDDRREGR